MTPSPTTIQSTSREAAFRNLFEAAYMRVKRYAERRLDDVSAAEDVAAAVFEIAWQKFDPNEPLDLPWLLRTAQHKLQDLSRGQRRGAAALAALARREEEPPCTVEQLDILALREALARLCTLDQEIVRLTYWDGLTAGEVGQLLRLREGAVWTRLHRARAQLRIALGDQTFEEVDHARRGARSTVAQKRAR